MTALWVLWLIYCLAFFTDALYVQPYRRRRASRSGRAYESGAVSFGIRAALPVFTLILFTRTFAVDRFQIPTPSMEPNLPQGTTIWVNRLAYGLRSPITGEAWLGEELPHHGDVIVFKYPREPRTTFVKRVIGVPGDRVQVDSGHVSLNGARILPPAGAELPSAGPIPARVGAVDYQYLDDPLLSPEQRLDVVVPPDHFFVLGDNLDHSEDSRHWGLVSSRHLLGRVAL